MCEHLRYVLYLVENRRRRDCIEESLRICAEPRYDVGVLEQEVTRGGEETSEEPRLASAARTGENHRREALRGLHDLRLDLSRDSAHA